MENFQLKNIKYSAFNSEETQCFEANLYYRGKKCAVAKNSGHGGGTDFYPLDDALFQDAVAYAESLPAVVTSIKNKDGTMWEMDQDLEGICNDLLTAHLIQKDFKRLVSKRVIYTKKGTAGIWQTGCAKNAATKQHWLGQIAALEDTDVVLNSLPMVDALDIFRAAQ